MEAKWRLQKFLFSFFLLPFTHCVLFTLWPVLLMKQSLWCSYSRAGQNVIFFSFPPILFQFFVLNSSRYTFNDSLHNYIQHMHVWGHLFHIFDCQFVVLLAQFSFSSFQYSKNVYKRLFFTICCSQGVDTFKELLISFESSIKWRFHNFRSFIEFFRSLPFFPLSNSANRENFEWKSGKTGKIQQRQNFGSKSCVALVKIKILSRKSYFFSKNAECI